MILDALETGFIEGAGPYYPQPRTPLRPRPERGFRGRTYCVAMSPDSVVSAARLGARMVLFSQRPWPDQAVSIDGYRTMFREEHGHEPGPPVVCDFVYCDTDASRAEEIAQQHLGGYLASVVEHYELADDHFKTARGYESYGAAVDALRAIGLDKLVDMYLGVQAWGTPEQVLERLSARREIIGDFALTCAFRYAGMPVQDAERSMRTFAEKVLPVLHRDSEFVTTGS
jgi:alkanesulfonate monooxygenase SsuD/methylene tetrahydromethanopterin reductase-like flavin-dependent oxidoreductase (luciferase family)